MLGTASKNEVLNVEHAICLETSAWAGPGRVATLTVMESPRTGRRQAFMSQPLGKMMMPAPHRSIELTRLEVGSGAAADSKTAKMLNLMWTG